jgi:hypothetical protein
MKVAGRAVAALMVLTLNACGSTPLTEVSRDNINVRVAQEVLDAPEKREAIGDYEVTQTVLRYVRHRFRKLKVRNTLQFDINITSMRLKTGIASHGVSRLNTITRVSEDGQLLKEVTYASVTRENKTDAVERMSKDTAKNLYENIKDL